MTQTKASDQTRNHLTVVLHKGLQHEIWFSKALVGLSQGWESILLLPQKRTPKVKQTTVLQGNPQKTLQRMDTLKRIYIHIYGSKFKFIIVSQDMQNRFLGTKYAKLSLTMFSTTKYQRLLLYPTICKIRIKHDQSWWVPRYLIFVP